VGAAAALGLLLLGSLLLGEDERRDAAPDRTAATGPVVVAPRAVSSPSSAPRATAKASAAARRASAARQRTGTAGYRGTGTFLVVPGRSAVSGDGPVRSYRVEVERGLAEDLDRYADDVASFVQRTLGDDRGWGHGGRLAFQRVAGGPVAFTVVLASPAATDRLCRPLETNGVFSCYMSGRAVINVMRWREGARSYAGHLQEYRQYVVSHEVGHALGHGHRYSCRPDGLAPVMMQQTKSLYGCRLNPWPYP